MTDKEKTRCIYSHSMDMKLHFFFFSHFFFFIFGIFSEFFIGFDLNSFFFLVYFLKVVRIKQVYMMV